MKYICLLRGVNVGVKARVAMAQLRQAFTDMGFVDVSTYINSGNVIFTASNIPDQQVIASKLAATFGFNIPVLVISARQLSAIVTAIPASWQNNYTEQKSDVAFLFPQVDSPDIITKIGYKPVNETILYTPGALLSTITRKNQPKSSLLKLIGTPLYANMTIRNITTARKLLQLATA